MEKGYLVVGSIGEYDDFTEWAVAFFTDQTKAGLWAIEAEKKSKELHEAWKNEKDTSKKYTDDGSVGSNPYDPESGYGHYGSGYCIVETLYNPKIIS